MVKVKYASDEDTVKSIQTAIIENDGYCPCRLDKVPENHCMCKEFRDFVKSQQIGTCHCGLYESYEDS